MASSNDVLNAIDTFEDRVYDVEEVLKPLLENGLSEAVKKLPLLDRAKLNVAVLFALESLLFSYIKANGTDPKDHEVRKEIDRLRKYHEKIQEAEQAATLTTKEPGMTLNKQAAARIIQHALAGNSTGSSDLAQKEREARERLLARKKQRMSETGTPSPSNAMPTPTPTPPIPNPIHAQKEILSLPLPNTEKEDFSGSEEGEIEDDAVDMQIDTAQPPSPIPTTLPTPRLSKKQKKKKQQQQQQLALTQGQSKVSPDKKAEKNARKKAKKEAAKIAAMEA